MNYKLKTVLLLVIMTLAIFALAGCGSNEESTSSTEPFTGDYVITSDQAVDSFGKDNVIFLDARGEDVASSGTVEGAAATTWQNLATVEEGKSGDANWGVILPTDELSKRLGDLGLDKEKEIIVFGAANEGWGDEGRIAWELMAAGYSDVKFVDGGFAALEEAGIATQKGAEELEPVKVEIAEIDNTHVINTDELTADIDKYTLIDTREEKEYEGGVYYGEETGGHIPGAINIPFVDLFNDDGTLKSQADLSAMFEENGISRDDEVVTYCTSGIRSAYFQLVLEMCGYEVTKNYDESYYRWCVVNEVEKSS